MTDCLRYKSRLPNCRLHAEQLRVQVFIGFSDQLPAACTTPQAVFFYFVSRQSAEAIQQSSGSYHHWPPACLHQQGLLAPTGAHAEDMYCSV